MSLSHEAQEFFFEIPDGYSITARRQLAELAIARILDRTNQGKGVDGDFAQLNAKYAEIKEASGGDPIPNLRLTGEMQSDLEYKPSRSSANKLCVGYKANTESNAKAKGHITGDIGVKRDFLRLSQDEIDDLTSKYPPDEQTNLLLEAIKLKDIVGKIATGAKVVTEI